MLALDDDPAVLDALHLILGRPGLHLVTIDQPADLWGKLQETVPDLIVLDVEMPGTSGLEVCRSLRADPTWTTVPVLFLTGRSDRETLQAVFEAGADDYVTKPIIGPELSSRIDNRIERIALLRRLAEQDSLTGVLNRRQASVLTERLIRLSPRTGEPVALALLDLDHFKSVNDRFGHQAGDDVLRHLGGLLHETFRDSDVVARWGGEEFLVAIYASTKAVAARRLETVLDRLREERFEGADGTPFSVTFSAGTAQYAKDGADLAELAAAADGALYRAKQKGRAQVVAC